MQRGPPFLSQPSLQPPSRTRPVTPLRSCPLFDYVIPLAPPAPNPLIIFTRRSDSPAPGGPIPFTFHYELATIPTIEPAAFFNFFFPFLLFSIFFLFSPSFSLSLTRSHVHTHTRARAFLSSFISFLLCFFLLSFPLWLRSILWLVLRYPSIYPVEVDRSRKSIRTCTYSRVYTYTYVCVRSSLFRLVWPLCFTCMPGLPGSLLPAGACAARDWNGT